MFYVTDDIRVRFKHFIEHKNGGKPTGMTNCTIEFRRLDGDKDEWLKVHIGTSFCSPKDQFDRSVGRKVALAKTLKQVPSTKQRLEYWQAYFKWNGGF